MDEYKLLHNKDPLMWSVSDVGIWLQHIHLGEHRIKFIENFIAGTELLDLCEEDLISLGVTAIGHRKKLMRAIKDLSEKVINGPSHGSVDDSDRHSDSGSEYSESSDTRSHDSAQNPTRVAMKCYYKKEVALISVKTSVTVSKLKAKIRDQFGRRLNIQIKDNDGDLITIKSDKDLFNAIRMIKAPIHVELSRRKKKRTRSSSSTSSSAGAKSDHGSSDESSKDIIPEAECAVLESLVSGAIVIQDDGYIKYFNAAAERIFGHPRADVIGHNVKMLMPSNYAAHHDSFIQRYIRTRQSKIVGTTRQVLCAHKSGYTFAADLSLTETRGPNRHTFTGIISPNVNANNNNDNAGGGAKEQGRSVDDTFSALNGLLEPAIVIDNRGSMLFVNKATIEFFGYSEFEMVGQNVNMLMPSPHKENHDNYLHNYLTSKRSTVIGKARQLICETSDGSIKPITLSVSESTVGGKQVFTGIIRDREVIPNRRQKTLLQQEREVVNSLFVAGIIIDRNGLIQAFNKGAQRIFGYDLSEVLGKNVSIITGRAHRDKHDEYIRRYFETGEAKIVGVEREVVTQNKAGHDIRIKLSVVEKKDEEGRSFFTGMLHQI